MNEIDYNGKPVNMVKYWEGTEEKGKKVRKEYQFLTDGEKVVEAGRKRWKIENEGFNRQKNWQGDITHACSHNEEAMKNHYLMTQISDMVKQLYEWFVLEAGGIRKKQKNISSDLLKSFGEQKTEREDIRRNDTQSVPAD